MSGDDEYAGGAPNITTETMLDYLNDQLNYDPVTQQFLDQEFAAARVTHALATGTDDWDGTIPSERSYALRSEMWARLIHDTSGDLCEHLRHRELQPTILLWEEHRQFCIDCAREWTVPESLTTGEQMCPGCGTVETLNPGANPFGGVWADLYQHGHYLALLMPCWECRHVLSSRQDLSPNIRYQVGKQRGSKA